MINQRFKILFISIALFISNHAFAELKTSFTEQQIADGLGKISVVLIEPDLELARVVAAGTPEIRVDWTEAAHSNLAYWLDKYFAENDIEFSTLDIPESEEGRRMNQLVKLHNVVAGEAFANVQKQIPSKKDRFEWTLGSGTQLIQQQTNADYGLFIIYRRGYTTAGRVGLAVATTILFGAVPITHYENGVATLVDLKTGELVWINRKIGGSGDLRNKEEGNLPVASLLEGFPGLTFPELEYQGKTNSRGSINNVSE